MSRKIVTAGVDQVTHCKHGHLYTPENSYLPPGKGPGARICRRPDIPSNLGWQAQGERS